MLPFTYMWQALTAFQPPVFEIEETHPEEKLILIHEDENFLIYKKVKDESNT